MSCRLLTRSLASCSLSAIINGSLQMLPEQKEDGATVAGGAVLDMALTKDR